MADRRHARGLADTSIVDIDARGLHGEVAAPTLTLAVLAAGPLAAERARRQDRPQCAEATFDPVPFDVASARKYGRISGSVVAAGRKTRAVDLLIAATALAAGLPLYTRNPDDFAGLAEVEIVAI